MTDLLSTISDMILKQTSLFDRERDGLRITVGHNMHAAIRRELTPSQLHHAELDNDYQIKKLMGVEYNYSPEAPADALYITENSSVR